MLSISGRPVKRWSDIKRIIGESRGEALAFDVSRGGRSIRFQVQPAKIEGTEQWVVGIVRPMELQEPAGPLARVGVAVGIVTATISSMGEVAWRLLSGRFEPRVETVGGPIAITHQVSPQPDARVEAATERYRFAASLTLVMINYLVWCLLPFVPYLDGRRLLFLGIEAVLRRTLHPTYQQWYNRVALILFGLLVLLAFGNDLMRYYMT